MMDPDRKILQERKASQQSTPLRRVTVHKGMLVITGIHLSVPFIKKGMSKHWITLMQRMKSLRQNS